MKNSIRRALVTAVAVAGLTGVFANPAGAGYGGIQASAWSGYKELGATMIWSNGAYIDWYTPSTGTCTHAYPYNDMYYNNLGGFDSYTFDYSDPTSNCNRVVLYLDGVQGGGGAQNCYRSQGTCYFPGKSFHSISWHNR